MTDEKNKSTLDEQTFAKLLEAAYVLQEHNREMRQMEESLELHSEQLRQHEAETQAALLRSAQRPPENPHPNPDYTLTLAEIVEAQHQIQIRHLESDNAMAVVAERIARITNASGAAIGILEGKTIRYRAGAGTPALPLGSEVPLETAICAICVRTGQVLRTPDVNTEFLFDPELCRAREIQSLVAVPVYHDGNIVGALELYFDRLNGFAEQDIHTCQLMAGLVTEAIGRDAGSALKKSMAAERSSMLAAIEKLKPNLTALAGNQADDQPSGIASANAGEPAVSAAESSVCWKCGSKVIEDEQFCGRCGAPRIGEGDPTSTQSKLASALHMQQASHAASAPSDETSRMVAAQQNERPGNAANYPSEDDDRLPAPLFLSGSEEKEPLSPQLAAASEAAEASKERISLGLQRGKNNAGSIPATLVESQPQDATWGSAAKAREFLEALAETRSPGALARFWHARRGDLASGAAPVATLLLMSDKICYPPGTGPCGSSPTTNSRPTAGSVL